MDRFPDPLRRREPQVPSEPTEPRDPTKPDVNVEPPNFPEIHRIRREEKQPERHD